MFSSRVRPRGGLRVVLLAVGAAATGSLLAAAEVTLVRDGQPGAVIVIPRESPPLVRDAAMLMQRVVERSSGARLAVSGKVPPGPDKVAVHLTINSGKHGLDKDGFIVAVSGERGVTIVGGSDYGVLFGVQDFLERYLGVRWLMPGRIGEHIPKTKTITIPEQEIREEPAFFSRQLSGRSFRMKSISTFLLRQRMHGRMAFHHNLLHLFPASKYTKTHPEFFPVLNGKRYLPPRDNDHHWQPDLAAPGIVDEAVRNICAYFSKHPNVESYSLGMNDSHAWDDSVMKAADARRNSLGFVDLSDYFFSWANRVVEGVLKQYPDKWFGCLAYNELVDPPRRVQVHPRILPYVCFDRMYWADPVLKKVDMERTKEWRRAADRLAWYDYIYGDEFYLAPRFYPHLMAEYVRFAQANGVVGYYAEAYPVPKWTEGPKLYVFLRLLWDPRLDVDAMLDEWYRLAVGKEAAPFLARYYSFWEEFWTKRAPGTAWFRNSAKSTGYLHFNDPGYFEALRPGDDRYLENLMKQVTARARTPEQKERAAFLYKGWTTVRSAMSRYLEIKRLEQEGPPPGATLEPVFRSDFGSPVSSGRGAAGRRPDWKAGGMPAGWSYWQRVSSHATFAWDRKSGRDDKGSLRIDASGSDGQPLCFLRTTTVRPKTLYQAACDVRTEDVAPDSAIGITIKWQDKNGKWATGVGSMSRHLKVPTNGKWVRVTAYVRTPDMEKPRLVLMLLVDHTKQGRVWFDNVELNRLILPGEKSQRKLRTGADR